MDDMACAQVPPVVRKEKKKQAKDVLDRQKHAEKKKRPQENALTTSAAIISELEKTKQKKIEEQQRVNEEGAAIAEAVALCVRLGEDSDDSCKILLMKGSTIWIVVAILASLWENGLRFLIMRNLRGEREQADTNRVEEGGEIKRTEEEREEKKTKERRRMLGNIRLIGGFYKKKMLTERIMHECIKKLLGQYQNPEEEDIEALCKLMSTIGEMLDHPKAKEYMDAYFDMMKKLSNNVKLSYRVRLMLKNAIDLIKNKWQQKRKIEGPKKIVQVHRDAAREQASRLGRGSVVRFDLHGSTLLSSPNAQMGGFSDLPSQVSGSAQDVGLEDRHSYKSRTLSVPLLQRPIEDDSVALAPQGSLARSMSIGGQPQVSSVPVADISLSLGDAGRTAAVPNGPMKPPLDLPSLLLNGRIVCIDMPGPSLPISVPHSMRLGPMYAMLARRRARILKEEMQEGSSLFTVPSYVPVPESFGFADELRSWTEKFGDGSSALPNIARKLIDAVRWLKGLPVEEKVVNHGFSVDTMETCAKSSWCMKIEEIRMNDRPKKKRKKDVCSVGVDQLEGLESKGRVVGIKSKAFVGRYCSNGRGSTYEPSNMSAAGTDFDNLDVFLRSKRDDCILPEVQMKEEIIEIAE
ncbi:hypothetical protein HHK36_000461 [Tetracentron sinense]|uniref:Uncharacterized protein n=1 Tax=Tetracentron sinense TaxID=13715 RepID=A0A834ZS77_TETSI|nr:hypothetical protein HHK36_000461 [Tetracentron sinense]